MKRLIAIVTLLVLTATPVRAETVETCSTNTSNYGSGTVCGAFTVKEHTETVEHKVVETSASDSQIINLLMGIAGAAVVATVLYKLTYKTYILG